MVADSHWAQNRTMSLVMILSVAALGLSRPVPVQAMPADRATYDSVVSCGATWNVSLVWALEAGDPVARQAATEQFSAFRALSRLYGSGLGLSRSAVDSAIHALADERLANTDRMGRSEAGRRLRDQAHEGEQAACAALAGRIASENAEPD